jgi:Domain of unknown function (DU1801)
MAENKTKVTQVSVEDHIAAIANEAQREDCATLVRLLQQWTKAPPKMWGPTIIGFGLYRYKYESGREGEMCITGFAARKNELVVYLVAEGEQQTQRLAQLGTHKMGKACLYFKRLSDIDVKVLEQLVKSSIAEIKQRYG